MGESLNTGIFKYRFQAIFDSRPKSISIILSDESGFSFSYKPDELTATRRWTVYELEPAKRAHNIWVVKVNPHSNGIEVNIDLKIMETNASGFQRTYLPSHPSTLELFWVRVSYVLGLREDWMTCQRYEREMKPLDWEMGYGLCGFQTDNKNPS